MPVQEKGDVLTQTIEDAREALRGPKREWSKEYTADESGPLIRAILAQTQGVKNPGNVSVVISGGEKGLDRVRAAVTIVGLEAKKAFVTIKVNKAGLELINARPNMPAGQERIAVTDNVVADPSTIMGQSVPAVLGAGVGGEKINDKIATDVFAKKLSTGPNAVRIRTYGVGLTTNNTLKISLTA